MTEDEQKLIFFIKNTVTNNPSIASPLIHAITDGVQDAIKNAKELASDMETLAAGAIGMLGQNKITPKTKEWFEKLVISKLEKHNLKTFCEWNWAIKKKEK